MRREVIPSEWVGTTVHLMTPPPGLTWKLLFEQMQEEGTEKDVGESDAFRVFGREVREPGENDILITQ